MQAYTHLGFRFAPMGTRHASDTLFICPAMDATHATAIQLLCEQK